MTGRGAGPENPELDLAQQGASIVGAVYVVGYLVVTFRWSQFGIIPVAWLRLQYLAAGIWCLLPVTLFSAALAFGALQFVEPWIKNSMVVPRKTRIYRYVIRSLQSGLFLVLAFITISAILARFLVTVSAGRRRSDSPGRAGKTRGICSRQLRLTTEGWRFWAGIQVFS